MQTETYPNTAPPGYRLDGEHPWQGRMAQRCSDDGQPLAAKVPLVDAWRAHRELERQREQHVAELPATREASMRSADNARRDALERYIVRHYTPTPRGLTMEAVADLLECDDDSDDSVGALEAAARRGRGTPARVGVSRRTLARWRDEPARLAEWLARVDMERLERFVCLLAAAPASPSGVARAPYQPATMRRRTTHRGSQIELNGPHTNIGALAEWATAQGATVDETLTRLTIRGTPALLASVWAALLALERWRTLTPNQADLDTWLAEVAT